MALVSAYIPEVKTTVYTVPNNTHTILISIHVANTSGASRTFTLFCQPPDGISVPFSPPNQALDANAVAVSTDTMHLKPKSVIQAIANGSNVTILITGKEIPATHYNNRYTAS